MPTSDSPVLRRGARISGLSRIVKYRSAANSPHAGRPVLSLDARVAGGCGRAAQPPIDLPSWPVRIRINQRIQRRWQAEDFMAGQCLLVSISLSYGLRTLGDKILVCQLIIIRLQDKTSCGSSVGRHVSDFQGISQTFVQLHNRVLVDSRCIQMQPVVVNVPPRCRSRIGC
jgi:hypothetical protein